MQDRDAASDRLSRRLWRARRRHDHIDAEIDPQDGAACTLRYFLNERLLVEFPFADREAAAEAALVKLSRLQLSGWATHW